jgi:Rrf2 family protein
MKFSTRTTYGLRAMIYLARNYGKKNISIAEISREESISSGYLEKLFSILKKSKLIKSAKGTKGGYVLAENPDKISIYDAVKVLEGSLTPFHCISEDGKLLCDGKSPCEVTKVLFKVQTAINKTLKSMTLNDLL